MTAHTVRFKQVDAFTAVPFKGNPLAVVFDADALDTAQMQAIARWTHLSETAFVVAPTDPAADYRVRIFTPQAELPFAGHPTLGTAHAVLDSGYRPKQAGRLVQQCGVGLVELSEQPDRTWAFAAPPARIMPLPDHEDAAVAAALRSDAIDFDARPTTVDNGVPWLVVRMRSARDCLALTPDDALLAQLTKRASAHGAAVYGPHDADGPATFEIRCLMSGGSLGIGEDPVTGSANAGLAMVLDAQQRRPADRYTARQGTVLGRAGDIGVHYDDAARKIWVGGPVVTVVDGTITLARDSAGA